jgi:hypothetical protein
VIGTLIFGGSAADGRDGLERPRGPAPQRCRPPRRGLTERPLRSLGAAKVVEDAANDAALGDEGDHPHHASAAGTDQRIGLVNPAKELSPRPGNLTLVISSFEER